MSLADELNWQSATELARLIRSKAVSPVELLRSCLATIERLNPKINAICTLAAESAMAAAQSAERAVMAGDEIGLLHGVPIGIKDLTPDGRHPHHLRFAALCQSHPERRCRGGETDQTGRRHRSG